LLKDKKWNTLSYSVKILKDFKKYNPGFRSIFNDKTLTSLTPPKKVLTEEKEPEQTKTTSNYEISSFTHSKTGEKLDLVKILPDIGQDNFRKLKSIVKNNYQGFYSRYAKGFLFPQGKGSDFLSFDLSNLDESTILTDTPKQKKSKNQKLPIYLQTFTEAEKKEMVEMGKNVWDIISKEKEPEQKAYLKNPVFLKNYLGYQMFSVYPDLQKRAEEQSGGDYIYTYNMFYGIPLWLKKQLAVKWFKMLLPIWSGIRPAPKPKRVTISTQMSDFKLTAKFDSSAKEFFDLNSSTAHAYGDGKTYREKTIQMLNLFNGGYYDYLESKRSGYYVDASFLFQNIDEIKEEKNTLGGEYVFIQKKPELDYILYQKQPNSTEKKAVYYRRNFKKEETAMKFLSKLKATEREKFNWIFNVTGMYYGRKGEGYFKMHPNNVKASLKPEQYISAYDLMTLELDNKIRIV
jgi:hypothetical protein